MKPTHSQKRTARQVAANVLRRFDPQRDNAIAALEPHLNTTDERQRATDLICAAVRNLTVIDDIITEFSSRPVERIAPDIRSTIRVATCELIFRPLTPDYSIVNEAVENTRKRAGKKQVGFVNAVLRHIQRHITNRNADLENADPATILPHSTTTGCQFDTEILPDPETYPAEHLAAAFSLPQWLVARWIKDFGQPAARNICFASNRTPGIYIRPNTLRTTPEELLAMMQEAEVECEIAPNTNMIRLTNPKAVTALPGFDEGLFVVQDLTASRAVNALDPQPGWTILDPCSAPGTKTTQIAQATNDNARIIATDVNTNRLKLLDRNIKRLQLSSIETVKYHDFHARIPTLDPFDAILLDVPCSNTGVLAKRIEVRHRITTKAIETLTKTQTKILQTYAPMLKTAGKLCYSTCSIQSDEGPAIIAAFLAENNQYTLLSEEMTTPSAEHCDHDGGYLAILQKN